MSTTSPLAAYLLDVQNRRLPICVVRDGVLLFSNPVWEGWMFLVRERPWLLPRGLLWLVAGLGSTERHLRARQGLRVARFPFRRDLVDALKVFRDGGGEVFVLCETDDALGREVEEYLGLFSGRIVVGSDRGTWATQLDKRFPDGYAAVGRDEDESCLLAGAQSACSIGAAGGTPSGEGIVRVPRGRSLLSAVVKQLRPHQWAKNGLLLVPLLLAPGVPSLGAMGLALLAAAAFSLCASAGYVLNDLLDLEADRAHRTKCKRPLASGDLPVVAALPLFLGLLAIGFGAAAYALPAAFVALLILYFLGTVSYSLVFKKKLLVDVLLLAGLYTHRILAGGVATHTPVSTWLLGFSMFLFTSLAFAKRYVELHAMGDETQVKNRGYFKSDLGMVMAMGTSSGNIGALVLVLYVDSAAVRVSYHEPVLLWLLLPVLLYWLGRLWLLAGRGQMQDDPVKFALKDTRSLICGAVAVGLVLLARFTPQPLVDFMSMLS